MLSQMSLMESILRGGGCGTSKRSQPQSVISNSNNHDLHNFFNKFNFYVEKIYTKAIVSADNSESQEIMIALQWFIFQEENIYNLNKNAQSVVKSYDLILKGIRKLLKSCLIYIRTDAFKCLYILQTTASLSKVIFSFHLLNQEKFMKCDLQHEFLDISDELSQQMEIEKNDLIQNQMKLYLFLTKTSFEISPNNSNEREEILKGCLSGIICSIIDMKPNKELFESLFQGACHPYNLYAVSNNRKQFEVYFLIDMLQWEIISYFKNEKLQNLDEIILHVQEMHDKIVKNSNVWKYHYLWVQMIGKILQYNPLLTKRKLSMLIDSFKFVLKADQIWKEYQRKGLIIEMNHGNDQAVIQLNQLKNNQLNQIDRKFFETCFKEWEIFLLFKDLLINEQYYNIPFTLGSYFQSKQVFEGKVPQKNETKFAINYINRFLDFMISNKLLTLTKENHEKLEEVIKNFRSFMKDKQCNDSTTLKISQQQIKNILQKLEEYFQNLQDIIKIMSLSKSKSKERYENTNFEKLSKLLSIQEILELYILDNERYQNDNDENDALQEWRNLIFEELKEFDQTDFKLSFFENTQNISKDLVRLWIEICQKEIRLKIDQIKNNFQQYIQNLLNDLCYYYTNKCNEIQDTFPEFNLYHKEIMVILYQIEAVPQIVELQKIKQTFADQHLLKFLKNLKYKSLKLKLKLITSKKSFSIILGEARPEELGQLSEVINLDEFLLNVIEDFPKKILRKQVNLNILLNELENIEIKTIDFESKLSKQKGIIKSFLFQWSIQERQIEEVGKVMELIEEEFGEQFIKESPSQFSMLKIKKIFEDLKVDESLKKVMDEKLNSSQLKLEQEKFHIFLSQLKKIDNLSRCSQIENWNQLIPQTESLIQILENFASSNKEVEKMLIYEELIQLKTIMSKQKLNYEKSKEQTSSKDGIKQERVDIVDNDKRHQIDQIQLNDQEEKRENCVVFNKQFNFSSNENYKSYLSFKIMVVKLKKLILKEEIALLHKILDEVVFISNKFSQIEEQKKEIQTKFQLQFKCCIQDFIQKFKQLQFSYVNLDQNDENLNLYLESLEKVNDNENTQIKINIFNLVQRFYFTNNEQWKIKQGLVFTIIQISSNCFSDNLASYSQKVLIQLWVQEKDLRVRNLLKNQKLISLQMQIFSNDWQSQHDRISGEMQKMLTRIDELQEQISHEANLNKRDLYLIELNETTEQLDQQIENISEMGEQLRLLTDFVNHIRKGLVRVEGKINEMKEQLKSIGNDIKFLRGKSVEQLFEIRKRKVLKDAALKNAKSIYVSQETKEIFHKTVNGEKKDDKLSILINLEQIDDANGLVNKFLLEEQKTVLLIHGVAGSGKSTAAKKIEEFIWKLHNNNNKIRNRILIPAYISLPQLKNPVFQAVEEALHQDEYGFDEFQLKEFKEMLEKKEFRLLLIMDGYDEMKLENIQKNLYMINKVKQNWSDPLVIFTTRSEIFTSSNYALWFAPYHVENLQEIQLQKFNSDQMMEYLKKFTFQCVKMLIFEINEWYSQISKQEGLDINNFEKSWEKLKESCLSTTYFNGEALLNQKQIENILSFLKYNLALKSNEVLRSLMVKLQNLWSVEKYKKMMEKISLYRLIETPYMMEIIVKVLPRMMVKASEIINLKPNFLKNFPKMLYEFYKSKYLIQMYNCQKKKYIKYDNDEKEQKDNFDNIDKEQQDNNEKEQQNHKKEKQDNNDNNGKEQQDNNEKEQQDNYENEYQVIAKFQNIDCFFFFYKFRQLSLSQKCFKTTLKIL